MTDSSNQSDATFVSDLNERLVKRATEPMGIIDVQYGQQKYYRIARWLAGRSSLFAELMKRYGVEEAIAYGEHPLAIQMNESDASPVLDPEMITVAVAEHVQRPYRGLEIHRVSVSELLLELLRVLGVDHHGR